MKNKAAIFIILSTLICLLLASCKPSKAEQEQENPTNPNIKVEYLLTEVGHGLSKVQLNDSTTILIYRGVESCTMLQLK